MIAAVPTNIITGFLGVGKTSTILDLLAQKPKHERWAILINEFGEVGIDGSLVQGFLKEDQQVFIKEVPGGCMCCAAGLPMQIALNQLLARAKPHRLLIEPTGLGHPIEVLETLDQPHYRDVLHIQKTITLIDARKLSDPRYTNHATFNQQIDIADIVVGNKQDLYQESDHQALLDYLSTRNHAHLPVIFTDNGRLNIDGLSGASDQLNMVKNRRKHDHSHDDAHGYPQLADNVALPENGRLSVKNQGEGFESIGWRFSPVNVFSRQAIITWIKSIRATRLKAVVITSEGIFGYNLADDMLTEKELNDTLESRIELIHNQLDEQWDQQLLDCLDDTFS